MFLFIDFKSNKSFFLQTKNDANKKPLRTKFKHKKINYYRNKVAKADIENVILELLEDVNDEDIINHLHLLMGRFQSILQNEKEGADYMNIERNHITAALLSIIDDIESHSNEEFYKG